MSSEGDGSTLMRPEIIKAVVGGVSAGILDRILLKNEDMTSNMTFGISVGASSLVGDYVGSSIGSVVPTGDVYVFSGKSIVQRFIEVSITVAGAYGSNKYLFTNDYEIRDWKRIGTIALCSVIGEYSADYLLSRPLGYLA